MSASARMNQYERGVHAPGYQMAEQLAKMLGVPVEYFYTKKDDTAQLLLWLHQLTAADREKVMAYVKELIECEAK